MVWLGTSMESQDQIDSLIAEASEVALKPELVQAFVSRLPESDELLSTALMIASEGRNARAFQALYFAALTGERAIPATCLHEGAALIEDVRLLLCTVLKVQGDIVAALTEAVRRGRMSVERESICLLLAWHSCNEQDMEVPHELILLSRRKVRTALREGCFMALVQYEALVKFTDDPVITALTASLKDRFGVETSLAKFRRQAESLWSVALLTGLQSEERVHSGSTLIRETPRIGRNDPCPCGSGKKYKKCCLGKSEGFDDYSADGLKLSELKDVPELGLTEAKVRDMRSYEVWNLRPEKIPDTVRISVVQRLILFEDLARAREVLEHKAPKDYDLRGLEVIYYDVYEHAKQGDHSLLAWFSEWAEGYFEPHFEAKTLLASREELVSMLISEVEMAFAATLAGEPFARVHYANVAHAAFFLSKPLGILIARGCLKDAEGLHHDLILDTIEDARDELGLAGDDQAVQISQAIMDNEDVAFETSFKLSKEQARAKKQVETRRQQAAKLETRISALEEDLKKLENKATEKTSPSPSAKAEPVASRSDNEIQERLAESNA